MRDLTSFTYLDKEYPVVITRKKMRRICYRLREDTFYISAPRLVSIDRIYSSLVKFAPKLIESQKPAPIGNNFVYVLGYKCSFDPNGGVLNFNNGESIKYKNREDFEKKMKKVLLRICTNRVRYFENLMRLEPHNVRVRDMSTRYGSNSKHTRTVTFALTLYHYSVDILDSIIVHELSHTIVFDHSKAFYDVVFKYCPNYKALHNKIKKGIYL